jgi:hypothetical protein
MSEWNSANRVVLIYMVHWSDFYVHIGARIVHGYEQEKVHLYFVTLIWVYWILFACMLCS